jgi:uncharacterized protein YeaO (DUF488 family)
MAIRVVRLGSPRRPSEGPRLGTVRRTPRGVPKRDFARRDYFDLWLPELAPSAPLVTWARGRPLNGPRWATFVRRYRAEMNRPSARRLLDLLAVISSGADFSVGCYCEDPSRCHRSILAELLEDRGAKVLRE